MAFLSPYPVAYPSGTLHVRTRPCGRMAHPRRLAINNALGHADHGMTAAAEAITAMIS